MKIESFTLWFTGLPCSGKTTLATRMTDYFQRSGRKVEMLDGDVVRTNLSKGLGFSREDRDTNIKRVGFVCNLLSRNGVIAVAALVSPYESSREEVRKSIKNFVLVHVNCSLEIAKNRDVKNLYKKALAGKIKNFTGVNDPYEIPLNPDIIVSTDNSSVDECVAVILQKLRELGYSA